jgi:hypothetical protein
MPASIPAGLLFLITLTTAAGAQNPSRPLAGPSPSQLRSVVARGPLQQPFAPDSVRRQIRPTHWKEGALIGGLASGLGLAFLFDGLCRGLSDNVDDCGGTLTAGFVTGGVLGGLLGALIGGQFPKGDGP